MAKYRHEVIKKCYINESLLEPGDKKPTIVATKKPYPYYDRPSSVVALDYTYVETEETETVDGVERPVFEIKYNKGISAPGVQIIDDDDDEDDEDDVAVTQTAANLAKQNGIELSEMVGTGKDGAITKKDVEAKIADLKNSDAV